MYRQYKALPEANRICMRAARERAYQQHLLALKKMKPSINNQKPVIPQTIGRNYKRCEIEKQRKAEIARYNNHILKSIESYQNQEHYPSNTPQRPFTLQGKAQKTEMSRITYENNKLLTAVECIKPVLNRNDWLKLKFDHQYQINKMSEYKKTIPMSEILRKETKSLYKKRSQSNLNNSRNSTSTENRSKSSSSRYDLEKENQDKVDSLINNNSSSNQDLKGRLDDENNERVDSLLSNENANDNDQSKNNEGKLEDLNDNFANAILNADNTNNNDQIKDDIENLPQNDNDKWQDDDNDDNNLLQNEDDNNNNNQLQNDDNDNIKLQNNEDNTQPENDKIDNEGGTLEKQANDITNALID